MSTSTTLYPVVSDRLALLSLTFAIGSAYVALDLVNWVSVSRGKRHALWLLLGSIAVGTGIWTANILGTEAYGLPDPVRYDMPTILAARTLTVLMSGACLFLLTRSAVSTREKLSFSLVLGFGSVWIHNLGLSALRMPARAVYSPEWSFAAAIAVVAVTYLALRAALVFRSDSNLWSVRKAAGASMLGLAVAFTHRIAGWAIHFVGPLLVAQRIHSTFAPIVPQRVILISTAGWSLALCLLALHVDRRLVLHTQKSLDSRAQLQAVFDNMTDGVIVWDLETSMVMMNRAASALLGIPMGTLSHQIAAKAVEYFDQHGELLSYDNWPGVKAERGEFVQNCEVAIRRKDTGAISHVEINTTAIRHKAGAIQQVIVGYRDVRERRRLDEARARLAAIVESSDDAIVSQTGTGIITSWNRGAERVFGYTSAEMVGQSILKLVPANIHDEEHRILERVRQGETVDHYETTRIRRDREPIYVSLTISPIRNAGGEVIGASKIARDVTNTKRLEQQLHQSQKMDAIGQLTGGIAHDFNNLLGIVIGNLDLLERDVRAHPLLLKQVEAAQKAALRCADLTGRLLTFASAEVLSPAPTEIQDCIRSVIEMATRAMGPEISITTAFDSRIPRLSVDVAGLERSLLNLLVNARDAMPMGGAITVRTQLSHLAETYPTMGTGEMRAGTYACVSVCDTGVGMSRETIEHAMEPFFTTKARGKGTGLGLAMVYGFAKQSGGSVRIYSELGYGTTVSFYLPIGNAHVEPATVSAKPHAEPSSEVGVVLLVDDEIELLDIAVEYVSTWGYTVLQATNAAAALRLIEERDDIRLLITDIVMPGGMNGIELARHAAERIPSLKVIYSSGFPADALSETRLPRFNGVFLHKPYQRRDLTDAIRRTMQPNRPGFSNDRQPN